MRRECTASSPLSVEATWRFSQEQARTEFKALETWMFSAEAMTLPLDEIEREQERRGREVYRLMLQAHIRARGTGDVGPAIEVASPEGGQAVRLGERREHECHQTTIFGEVAVKRLGYSRAGHPAIHPLDRDLALPEDSYSYEVQRRAIKAAVQGPFDEAIERVEESTGVALPKRSAEEIVKEAAADFDAFYAQRVPATPESTGPILVGAVDGKGIPMVKPGKAERVVRRTKGKKANKKRMATVATVFTILPRVRTPEEVAESLFWPELKRSEEEKKRPRPRPENKRVWASLKQSKDAVIDEVGKEMRRRDPEGSKKHVVVTDGERALQIRVRKRLGPSVLLILDLLHVLEKLWKAAYVFHAEGTEEAAHWVHMRAFKILCGGVSQVVKGLRQTVTKRRLRGERRKTLLGVAGYLYRNRTRMRYHEYLAAGLPIASGAVEGACKNLVKDRMERSGMRWKEDSAEAMLRLRATYLSGDFEEYWAFHVKQDQGRLHPPGAWRALQQVVEE
ncbi:MAG: ISKra4 family transposase [Nitrospiraceae bacterium]